MRPFNDKHNNQQQSRSVGPPVKIRWPKAFYRSQPKHQIYGNYTEPEPALANTETNSDLSSQENSKPADACFNPKYTGSYPPKPKCIRLFKELKSVPRPKLMLGLSILEEDEDKKAQPERDMDILGKAKSSRRTTFAFPLDLFYNPELELCHPSLDLKQAHANNEPGVTGRSRYYSTRGECSWEPCLVLDYNEEKGDFLIEWVKTKKQKTVKRLNLILDREKEINFIAKVLDAKKLRTIMQTDMRYFEYLEGLPFENAELSDTALKTLLIDMAGSGLSKRYPDLVEDYMISLKDDYCRSVKKLVLNHKYFVSKENVAKLKALQIYHCDMPKPPVPGQGCYPVGFAVKNAMAFLKVIISQNLCLAEEAFLLGLLKFQKEMEITDICLFSPQLFTLPRPLKLEDFRLVQEDYLRAVADNFRNDWIPRVVAMIDELAPPTNELKGTTLEKLRGFVRRLSFTMTQQLLDVALSSMEAYQGLWEQYSINYTDVNHDEEDGLHLTPMFRIRLKVEGDHFAFDPSLGLIESTVLLLLDNMLASIRGIEDLQSRVTTISTIYQFREMRTLEVDDPRFLLCRKTIEEILEMNFRLPRKLEESYMKFQELAAIKIDEFLANWKNEKHSIEDYEEAITKYLDVADKAKKNSPAEVLYGLLLIECFSLGEELYLKSMDIANRLSAQLLDSTNMKNKSVCEKYTEIDARLNTIIGNPEDLDELRKFVATTKKELIQLQEEINQSAKVWDMLSRKNYTISDQEMDLYWVTFGWPQKIGFTMEECEAKLAQGKTKFTSELAMDQLNLKGEIKILNEEIHDFMKLGDISSFEERLAFVLEIETKLRKLTALGELYNNREQILGLLPTEYPQFDQMSKEFEQYGILWHVCGDFMHALPQWVDGPFNQINAEEVVSSVDKWFRSAMKCSKQTVGEAKLVAEELKKRIERFQINIPMISSLRNPGMRDRHWKKLSDRLGFEVSPHAGFSLSTALQLNLLQFIGIIDEVSEFASKEYSVEVALDKMQGDWIGVKFEYAMWRDTGTAILRSLDDLQTMLEDHIAKTQSMQASPYIAPFEDRVKLWLSKLNLVQEVLDEWINCQQQWLYLEPIFGSEDIMQQMPTEGRRFKVVDTSWRKIMEKLMKNPEVLVVGTDEDLLKNLKEANKQLDIVQKGLNEYLETKRLAFPRFYFLSNDELLEILAETKDPLRVQPFCKKIFEGIHRLQFQDNMDISAMFSEEGEKVNFIKLFNPKDAQGAVEKWLIQVEDAMRMSLKDVTLRAYEAYAVTERVQWVLSWPGQVVLCVSQMYWTAEVADSIQKGTLQSYQQKCNQQLQAIVNKVRGKLTSLERKTIGALIVIDVHARDVVKSLADANIADETDFEWISQLRYGYEDGEVIVRMINASQKYAFEYLGNSSRLVITPLTDRCYRTLMGALHLNLGGAPEGPAGTGKTETTKDLAKAIAMQCVVFNCSDGLDYLAMGKFFKGLASSGAWACFDEFNRIDLEVLSVIAQQILTIQRAKAAGLKMFEFEGVKLTLSITCSVFITMNPGYAGRSELPDNLKALFRTVAMMVPDYALISEITLYSFGYLQARELARKLVATYRLCSEQLSSQNHYDYGMRAVISVLRAAGAVKQKFPDEKESILMLKSLKDVNLPKFLAHDIPLFEGILIDLFPGVVLPAPDYTLMREAIIAVCGKRNLQPTPIFLEKIFQLYEMILVRHGLMLVGYSYGAKTEAYRVLAAALSDLCNAGKMENVTKCFIINPKSVYIGQLYGQFDPISHEWTDGVLAKSFRNAAVDTTPDRKWIIFDGPVDAVWIENMNTVLDDNKKLCLMSGEIVQMTGSMNLIFEVQDLAVASPATVSRCGMVYTEPGQIGWVPHKASWMAKLPVRFPGVAEQAGIIEALLDWLVEPCLQFVKKYCKELVPTSSINLVQSLLNMFESLLDEFRPPNPEVKSTDDSVVVPTGKDLETWLHCLFAMSLVWSIGGVIDADSRQKFDGFFRKLLAQDDNLGYHLSAGLRIQKPSFPFGLPFPVTGSVFNFVFLKHETCWKEWMESTDKRQPGNDAEFTDIIVSTVDTARYSYLLKLQLTHQKHVMLVGATGTGKTAYIKRELAENLDKSLYRNIMMTFSAQTNANVTQDIIDSKLDKRRKGVFGPPFGTKCVILVDDLNMPALEVYGAQPPIEILRQWMDHGGWYDRTDNTFRQIVDVQFVTAMGPPGGGRNPITPRYLRHFHVLAVADFDDASLSTIFGTIMVWWARKIHLPTDVAPISSALVNATIDIYREIQRELLPTPSKSHYTYNLRDLSKVFQGVCMMGGALDSKKSLVRLWCHECMRIFHDRLVDDNDRHWFFNYLGKMVEQRLSLQCDFVLDPPEDGRAFNLDDAFKNLAFGDIMDTNNIPKKYEEILDQKKLLVFIEEGLAEFNAQTRTPLSLVLFSYVAQHILRISRIISQPFGNALLVGVGGVGRQSLTKLATYMAGFNLFQIQITKIYGMTEWQEDLKYVLKKAGGEGSPTVFIFSDTQLKEERFLEDINNILNTGEVPNLFAKDEIITLQDMVRARAKKAGKDSSPAEIYMYFVDQCRKNLHMVICMSPFGSSFRTRLRMFPSLVNCCTIDWFTEWPDDALYSVGSKFLSAIAMEDANLLPSIRDMCVMFHQNARNLSAVFYQEQRRHFYVTPTSYLELLSTYKDLLAQKRLEIATQKKRYEVGLEKLFDAEGQVNVMKKELEALQPVLMKTAEETDSLLKIINRDRKEAEKTRSVVEEEEAVANVKAKEAEAIKADCESELAVAMPMLEAALSALDTLTKSDITEVKAMKNPPAPVKLVMEACCIMKGVKSRRIPDPNNPGKKIDDFWGPAQQMLTDTNFLQSLKDFDKDHIPQDIIDKVRPYLGKDNFDPEVVKKASKAAYGLCSWIRAMESYHKVAQVVAPKKAKLEAATAEFEALQAALSKKKAILKEVEEKLQKLQEQLDIMEKKKAALEQDVDNCQKKLSRAEKLIGGLGGEKVRWTNVGEELGKVYRNLTGDVLLASGYVAYLGPVTLPYRERVMSEWIKACVTKNIPCSDNFKLATILGSPVAIRDWVIDGLPNDSFSIDNGIIISSARRWPLLIDPQGQANKWIKTKEKAKNLQVTKLSDPDFVRKLENCITFGYPLLLENVGEELDPTLEPVLLKNVFKQAGSLQIRLGDTTLEYSENFRFYITTKLRNPHYMPEVAVKVTLLNFMITPEGLEDQILGIAVKNERPDLEEEKTQLVLQSAENQRQLSDIEDRIIKVLSSSEGNILENETAINIISTSKVLSIDIAEKQKVAEKTEAKIDEARKGYLPVATHVASLFFTVSTLCSIDPMYQYSLSWYLNLFQSATRDSEKTNLLPKRIEILNDYFTYSLFCQLSRSLFEKDKLLLSFLVCTDSMLRQKKIAPEELRFLVAGAVIIEREKSKPPASWLAQKLWTEMILLSKMEAFQGFSNHFAENPKKWKHIYDSPEPYKEALPDDWSTKLTSFQKLLIIRTIRPDLLVLSVNSFVFETMGQRYVEPPTFDLGKVYRDSSPTIPLVFVLSPGSDPMAALLKYAEGLRQNVQSISLGQGQGPKAAALIQAGIQVGDWVVLQNCHLASSWMPQLERICENFGSENINASFRLWLTSYPSENFPVTILQNSIKMTNESPKGLRANMLQNYQSDPISDPKFFEMTSEKGPAWRKMLFGLCFFHASVQERVKFGPLGWNIPYQFSDSDLKISMRQLRSFLEEFPESIPFKALVYLTGECNYGGRVTDAHDRRTLMCLLSTIYNPKILDDGFRFSSSGVYTTPPDGPYQDFIGHIRQFPLIATPDVFGLHENATITKDQQETDMFLSSILATQSNEAQAGGRSREEVILELVQDMASRIPPAFDIDLARYRYPVQYIDSMNSVLHQEMTRYNNLTEVIRTSLQVLQKTLKGLVVMSAEIEKLSNSVFNGKIPAMWASKSFPSLKPLSSYVADLTQRLSMFSTWMDKGPPPRFWITGFFFTHAFLTAVLQNYARKYKIPIDTVVFEFQCLPKEGAYEHGPEDGVYVEGMFLEGARWDYDTMMLAESQPKVLFSAAPMIWLKPTEASKKKEGHCYRCPLYRTTERRGVLATTGHSSNFVTNVELPTDKASEHWVRRGVAMFLSLSD
uniref:Axonemal inner arm dynein heavy chain 2 n=1 Tax=Marsilea vestita TaxID=59764 RepID=A0A126TIL5_MARVE|nr:axonemal inner arm dynein heavy chain 2 [Marsilea vestita]